MRLQWLMRSNLFIAFIVLEIKYSVQFQIRLERPPTREKRTFDGSSPQPQPLISLQGGHPGRDGRFLPTLSASTVDGNGITTSVSLQRKIRDSLSRNLVDEAIALLDEAEDRLLKQTGPQELAGFTTDFTDLMQKISAQGHSDSPEKAERVLHHMNIASCTPIVVHFNCLILAWSKSGRDEAGSRCDAILDSLWKKYDETGDKRFLPTKSTYVSTLTAWSRSKQGATATNRVEALLEDMERHGRRYEGLIPCTIAVNIVLNTWSKSRLREAPDRCESILARMEELFLSGRDDAAPDTVSFNTVIDTLAQSRSRGCERRAETLLEHMHELASEHESLSSRCRPDTISFNVVMNAWARSKEFGAARRADAILRHMERRWQNEDADIRPDTAAYNTVLTAWARSKDKEAPKRAQLLFQRMEDAWKADNTAAKPNVVSYNILIDALVKARAENYCERVLALLARMKERDLPDVVSYTSCIDALAKEATLASSIKAEKLLHELEEQYALKTTESLRPNIRSYTSVIHAIARSRKDPGRAERIVSQLEKMFEDGDSAVQPDTVCYDAVINAFGWANDYPNKAAKCFAIYQRMVDLYESGGNKDAKPDVITLNSVLNACAYDGAQSSEDKEQIVQIVVQLFETFQSKIPEFGCPNHITYANALGAVTKHMKASTMRDDLAETLFWQCCERGNTSVLVINHLFQAISYDRLVKILGDALLSDESESRVRFNPKLLPKAWTKNAPKKKTKRYSRPTTKSTAFHRTKGAGRRS